MGSSRAILSIGSQSKPIWRHVTGVQKTEVEQTTTKPTKDIWGNVSSIFGSVSTGISSIFGSLTSRNELQMQQNALAAQQQQKAGQTVMWVVGGVVLLVVVVLIMRK